MNDKLIKSKSTAFYEIRDYIMICLGTLIYTGGVSIFMLPYGLTIGGVSGISSGSLTRKLVSIAVTFRYLINASLSSGLAFLKITVRPSFVCISLS